MLIKIQKNRLNLMLTVAASILLMECSTAYYGTMEKLGYPKRDLMVSRVESARDAQQEAKDQFESALEKFSSVLKVDGGELDGIDVLRVVASAVGVGVRQDERRVGVGDDAQIGRHREGRADELGRAGERGEGRRGLEPQRGQPLRRPLHPHRARHLRRPGRRPR